MRRLLVLVSTAAALVAVVAASGPLARVAVTPRGTIVFASDRTGNFEIYSMRADGTRLGQLTRSPVDEMEPVLSPDGRRIVFARADRTGHSLWLANADGNRPRRLAPLGYDPDWSPDSRHVVFEAHGRSRALSVATLDGRSRVITRGRDANPSWSPDGRHIAFSREVKVGTQFDLLVVDSNGRGRRTLRRKIAYNGFHDWSASGWISFLTRRGLEVVRADGSRQRVIVRGSSRSLVWSPDGSRVALFDQRGRLSVAPVAGRPVRDITPKRSRLNGFPAWSPDGRWIAMRNLPAGAMHADILVIATNGSSWRRIASPLPRPWGSEMLQPTWSPRGTGRLGRVPVPALPSESVSRTAYQPAGPGRIIGLAADGSRILVITEYKRGCASVEAWEQTRPRIVRFQRPCGPNEEISIREGTDGPAVAGTSVAWRHLTGGNSLEMSVRLASLSGPGPVSIGAGGMIDESHGTFATTPVGHDALIAFTVGRRCDAEEGAPPEYRCPPGRRHGDVIEATVWRAGGAGRCPTGRGVCERVAQAPGDLTVLAVDAGRIAARADSGVTLLTSAGTVLRDFPVTASAAALSGTRLAVRTADAVEIYDVGSGEQLDRIPVARAVRLEDMQGELLLTASSTALTIRRLADGRTTTVRTAGAARGQLEAAGLFAAGARRVAFIPMAEVLSRLG
jgi:Tol biopolymer transport system component